MRTEVTINGGSSFFQGSVAEVIEFSSTEDATTIDPSNYNGGFGQITVSARPVRDTKMAQGKILQLSDADKGKTTGIVRDVSVSDKVATFTGDSVLGLFNTYHTIGPQIGTLEQAINAYTDLVGITNLVEVDPSIASRPVQYPGFSGNVWDTIKRITAAEQIEVALVYDKIVVRPLRTLQANLDRTSSLTENVNTQSTAKLVQVYYYPTETVAQGVVYPVSGEEPNILQVDAGETREFVLPLKASMTSINQPVPYYNLPYDTWDNTPGAYVVCGNDGLPIQPAQWAAQGGLLTVALDETGSTITVTVTGASNVNLAPYRIAESSGASTFYSALHITGAGVRWTEEMITLTTGATSATTGEEVGATVTNPYIQTLAQAYTAGMRASGTYAGPVYTVSGTALNINRAGGNRDEVAATFLDYNRWWAETHPGETQFANFNAAWNGQTFAQFNAFWDERMANLFTNQAFGNAVGARVRLDDAFFRINTATISTRDISYSASLDTTIGDYNNENGAVLPFTELTTTNYAKNPQARGLAPANSVANFAGYSPGAGETGETMTTDGPLDTAVVATNYVRNPRVVAAGAQNGWFYQVAGGEVTVFAPSYATDNGVANARTNYILNPSFETNTTSWATSACTISRGTTSRPERVGSYVGVITVADPTGTVFASGLAPDAILTEGQWVNASVLVGRSSGATYARVGIQWFAGASAISGVTVGPYQALSGSSMDRLTISGVAPATATTARLLIYPAASAAGGTPPNGNTFIDGAILEVAPTEAAALGQAAAPYFDGNSSLTYGLYDSLYTTRWESTANNSVSYMRWSVAPGALITPIGLPGFNRRYISVPGDTTGAGGPYFRAIAGDITGVAGDRLTHSTYVRSSVDLDVILSTQYRLGATTVSGSAGSANYSLRAGEWTRVSVQGPASSGAFDGFQLWVVIPAGVALPYGEFIDVGGASTELNTSVLGKYFDYGTPTEDVFGDIRYGHRLTGALYASSSVRYSTISPAFSTPLPNITSFARRVVTNLRTGGSVGWQATAASYRGLVTGTVGAKSTASGWFRYVGPDPVRRFFLRNQMYDAAGNPAGVENTQVDLKSGEWTYVSSTATATADFASIGWWLYQFYVPEQVMQPESVIDVTGIMMVPGADASVQFFDGDTPWGNLLSYAWTSTAYASPSIQRLHATEPSKGQTFAQFNALRAGYTFGDFAISPLRSTNG